MADEEQHSWIFGLGQERETLIRELRGDALSPPFPGLDQSTNQRTFRYKWNGHPWIQWYNTSGRTMCVGIFLEIRNSQSINKRSICLLGCNRVCNTGLKNRKQQTRKLARVGRNLFEQVVKATPISEIYLSTTRQYLTIKRPV